MTVNPPRHPALSPQRLFGDIERRIHDLEHNVTDNVGARIDALEQLVQDTLVALQTTSPPPAPTPSGPRNIGGASMGKQTFNEGTYRLCRAGFSVPSGGGKVTVTGSLAFETHWWEYDTTAVAFLEIANVVDSDQTRITHGPYLTVITASPAPVVVNPLGAGQYEARWVLELGYGNRGVVQSCDVAVTLG